MSKREDSLLFEDILESIQKINRYNKNIGFNEFLQNSMLVDATVRNFEIIGEASNRLSEKSKVANPQIDWIRMAGFRNRLIHEYFGVNLELVWEIIKMELPILESDMEEIIESNQ